MYQHLQTAVFSKKYQEIHLHFSELSHPGGTTYSIQVLNLDIFFIWLFACREIKVDEICFRA